MKQISTYILMAAFICFLIPITGLAVGELLGLTVRVELSDGSTVQGKVVGETETTLRIDQGQSVIIVERDMIVEIHLVEPRTPDTTTPPELDPFRDVQVQAMKKAAFWQLGRDVLSTGEAITLSQCAQEQRQICNRSLIITYLGLRVGGLIWNIATMPSIEQRLYWDANVPPWYGILGFAEGVVTLGAAVSHSVAIVQDSVNLPELGPASRWYGRATALYLLQAAINVVRVVYDASVLASSGS